eukprot:CAMPEP_0184487044 /NCGR_PEP_ID=MMETSP0113_2-20130426/9070_1 /TAXON_ID=91329 /ORGANISM="Norrisiella sphaerica, Strain BC52" /LENGTH=48 /DNA_ID= /DNA_START= /DNA_END= /DNA_ORIENTATION=
MTEMTGSTPQAESVDIGTRVVRSSEDSSKLIKGARFVEVGGRWVRLWD